MTIINSTTNVVRYRLEPRNYSTTNLLAVRIDRFANQREHKVLPVLIEVGPVVFDIQNLIRNSPINGSVPERSPSAPRAYPFAAVLIGRVLPHRLDVVLEQMVVALEVNGAGPDRVTIVPEMRSFKSASKLQAHMLAGPNHSRPETLDRVERAGRLQA